MDREVIFRKLRLEVSDQFAINEKWSAMRGRAPELVGK